MLLNGNIKKEIVGFYLNGGKSIISNNFDIATPIGCVVEYIIRVFGPLMSFWTVLDIKL